MNIGSLTSSLLPIVKSPLGPGRKLNCLHGTSQEDRATQGNQLGTSAYGHIHLLSARTGANGSVSSLSASLTIGQVEKLT